jgi:2-polyprenyl-6-methoxyphenol hydroxylase-like FAD-dependent oxidoreductase
VQVHEKRGEYRRDTWFDIEPKPWSTSRDTLESAWGLRYQELEHIVHDSMKDVITVRTQNLERYVINVVSYTDWPRFLSKLVTILNITIVYHSEFVTFCNRTSQFTAIFYNTSTPQQPEPPNNWCDSLLETGIYQSTNFDVIVGCDGFASRVRNASNIGKSGQRHVITQ